MLAIQHRKYILRTISAVFILNFCHKISHLRWGKGIGGEDHNVMKKEEELTSNKDKPFNAISGTSSQVTL